MRVSFNLNKRITISNPPSRTLPREVLLEAIREDLSNAVREKIGLEPAKISPFCSLKLSPWRAFLYTCIEVAGGWVDVSVSLSKRGTNYAFGKVIMDVCKVV